MHHLIGSSATRLRRYSWLICCGLLVVLLSLFASIFSDSGLSVHAATGSSLKNMHGPGNYHPNSHHLHMKNFSHIRLIQAKSPALTLTRTMSPGVISHGKQAVNYMLSVSNGRSSGPVEAGNTIIINNVIPVGMTDVTIHANYFAWRVKLTAKTGPSTLTATYVGAYPVLAGTSLSPLLIHGTLAHSHTHQLFQPAVVRLLHLDNTKENNAKSLQQQSAHDFTVQYIAPRVVKPLVNPTYQVGQTVEYTLAISNNSTAGALLTGDSVTVTDAIPAGLTGLTASASSSDWTVSLGSTTSPTTLTATYIGTYPVLPGAAFSPIIVVGTLTTPAIPQVANTAVVVTPNDINAANNSGTSTITVVAQPDLTVTDPVPTGTTFEVGKTVTYTITGSSLSSAGPVLTGNAITIMGTIPAGLTGITATDSSGNWSLSLSSTSGPSILTATYIGAYPVAAGTTLPPITITGTLASAAVPNLANNAAISTPNESNTTNNTASNTIPVVVQPDLTLTKTVPPGTTFQVGKTVTYTLTPSNTSSAGPIIASDPITIIDTIPAGLTGLTASANSDWSVSLSTTTSPATLTATYTGTYPVASGATLSPITLTGLLTTGTLSTNPIPTGYWPFDANSGTTAYDFSPNHNNGMINGASWTTGKINSGLSFNGTNNYVNMGNPASLQPGANSSFTVMAWFKTSASPTFKRIVSEGLGNWNGGFTLGMSGTCTGCITGEIGDTNSFSGNALNFDETTPFNDGAWHQAALVVDRTAQTAQIYIDGVAQPVAVPSGYCGTASGTTVNIASCNLLTTATTDPFTVGAYNGASGNFQYFPGSIDEVRFYNSALSSAQIQKQYIIDTPPTPTGYWPFDANTGTTAYDLSPNHNNGTLTGGPTWTVGAINSGLSFNGTSNYVTMGNLPALQFGTGSFTALAWFKTTIGSGMKRILNQGVGTWNGGFNISMNAYCSGCLTIEIGGSGTGATSMVAGGNTAFNDGKWHQVAMVVDGTAKTAQLYVDGVAQAISVKGSTCGTISGTSDNIASCSSLTANTTDPFVVGVYTGTSGTFQYFNGSIDEVRIYGSALSSAQIQNLYAIPFTNTAAVTTPNDSNFTNNGAINTIMVIPQPDLSLSKTSVLAPTLSVRKQAQKQRLRSILRMRPS